MRAKKWATGKGLPLTDRPDGRALPMGKLFVRMPLYPGRKKR